MNQASTSAIFTLSVAPAKVLRGDRILEQAGNAISHLGNRPLIVGGDRTLKATLPRLQSVLAAQELDASTANYGFDCSEAGLATMGEAVKAHRADLIIGVGGGKALDAASY